MTKESPLRRLLESRWLIPIAVLLPLVLQVHALGFGLAADDYLQHAKLVGGEGYDVQRALLPDYFSGNPLWTLFEFFPQSPSDFDQMVRAGILPWWAEPGASATFFRPVTAATHVLDTRLFGDAFWGHHLHSFVWAGLGVWVVAGLYRRLLPHPVVAGLAILAFSMEEAHTMATVWLANRNAWVALVFGVLAMRLHLSSRRGASALASVSFGLALGAGEMGLCAGAYLLSWEVWMGQGGLRSRIRRLLPYAGVFLVWVLMYTKGAFGVIGSGLYVDPIQATGPFLEQLPGKFSVLLASQAFQVPPEIWMLLPSGGDAWLAAGSLLALGLTVWAMLPWFLADRNRLFWATGLVLCLLPVCSGFPMRRLLMFAGLGFFPLLAEAGCSALGWSREQEEAQPFRRRGFALLLWIHIPMGVLFLPLEAKLTMTTLSVFEEEAVGLEDLPELEKKDLVVLSSFDVGHAFLPMVRTEHGRPSPRGQYLLGGLTADMVIHRTSEDTLLVDFPQGVVPGRIDWMTRGPWSPLVTGFEVETDLFVATVLDGSRASGPTRVRFSFNRPVGSEDIVWRSPSGRGSEPFDPPPVGESVEVSGRTLLDLLY